MRRVPEVAGIEVASIRLGWVRRCAAGRRRRGALLGLATLALCTSVVLGSQARASGEAPAAEASSTMPQKLSSKLSPKAKKALMVGGDQRVSGLVTMAPTADRVELERQIAALGGRVESWDPVTALAAVELPAVQLGALADLDGVVHVEVGEAYRP